MCRVTKYTCPVVRAVHPFGVMVPMFSIELKYQITCATQLLTCHHIFSNSFYKVPTSNTCTSNMPMSLLPSQFSSFFMSYIKGMREFGLTLTHVSLKSSPSASCVNQNLCNNCMKETSPIPPVPQTCPTFFCSDLDWALRQQLKMRQKKLIRPIFLSSLARLYVTPLPPESVVCARISVLPPSYR